MSWLAAARKRVLEMLASLGCALGRCQFAVQPCQFLGALAHTLFQRRVRALQCFRGLETRSDVRESDNQRAARHAVGANLDHHVAVGQPFQVGLAFGGVSGEPAVAAWSGHGRCLPVRCCRCIREFRSAECRSAHTVREDRESRPNCRFEVMSWSSGLKTAMPWRT